MGVEQEYYDGGEGMDMSKIRRNSNIIRKIIGINVILILSLVANLSASGKYTYDDLLIEQKNIIKGCLVELKKMKITKNKFEHTNWYDGDSVIQRIKIIEKTYNNNESLDEITSMANEIPLYVGQAGSFDFYEKCLASKVPKIGNDELFSCKYPTWTSIYNRGGMNFIYKCELYLSFKNLVCVKRNIKKYEIIIDNIKDDPFLSFCAKNNEKIYNISLRDGFPDRKEILTELNAMAPMYLERYFRLEDRGPRRLLHYFIDVYKIYAGINKRYVADKKADSLENEKRLNMLVSEETQTFMRNFLKYAKVDGHRISEKSMQYYRTFLEKIMQLAEEEKRKK